ncbi:MAG TPA: hypothetical protein DEA08_04325 [Planctomycetes bacterium]|nr:hypothetical protein [Planctomycetota bacterium]
MRRCPNLLPVLVLLATPALAQEDPLSVKFSLEPPRAQPGDTVELRADVTLPAGHYVYGSSEEGVGVSLSAELPAGLASGAFVEPKPKDKDIPYVGVKGVHTGTFRLVRKVEVKPDASGSQTIQASFGYQVCNDKVCLAPTSKGAALTLEVLPAASDEPGEPKADPLDGPDPLDAPDPLDGPDPLAGSPFGDPLGDPLGGGANEKVSLSASPSHALAPPGARVELRLQAKLRGEWHIYGVASPNGSPTKLELKLPKGAKLLGGLQESPPKQEEVEHFGPVTAHYRAATFTQVVQLPTEPGDYTFAGKLSYQACDPQTCVDEAVSFRATVKVEAGAPETGIGEPAAPANPAPEASPAEGEPKQAKEKKPQSMLALFVASVGLGLFMLLMPCTYPMIPITISVFSKGEQVSRGATALRAFVYAAGIVISFLVVGGVVQVVVGGQGQASVTALATNAWVNLLIGVVFVYFAFSFFGYYELGLPAPLQKLMQFGQAQTAGDGSVPTWSLFLMGLFFVLTSYTCGAPVVLSLFATAASDPHPFAVLFATAVFACTVATPFFLLALVPNAMKVMPNSGAWFNVFKVVLGMVEIGFAVKFFRGTDLQWDLELLTRPVTLAIWLGLCVLASVYLVGRLPLKFPHDPPLRPVSKQRLFWAAALLGLAGYFGYGLAGNQLHPAVEAFILAKNAKGDSEHSIKWVEGDEALSYRTDLASLEAAQQEVGPEGRIFLMFTGHNCVNCVQMEKGVLPQGPVRELLAKVPRVALFTDKGEVEAKHRNLMVERYNKAGAIPAFYVIDGKGEVRSSHIGLTSVEDFAAFLQQGGLK